MDVLTTHQLSKRYPGQKGPPAVDGISFRLKEGEILGLLGPNGSGKTTTIQMLLGTLSVTSGSITYFGQDFHTHRHKIARSIGYASAYTNLPWILTVAENLKVIGRLYGLPPRDSEKRFDPLLERFGILNKRQARVASLSAGQATRLMLVKAFFVNPRVVLLDEPTASLDPDVAKEICGFILEQRDRTGMSVLFTSHKMEEATELCDRAVFLKAGRIIADDVPQKLAQSVSAFRLRLTIIDGLKRTIALATERQLPFKVDHRSIEITIDEGVIPAFLNAIGEAKISYSSIKIDEPSLEDFFLQIVKE